VKGAVLGSLILPSAANVIPFPAAASLAGSAGYYASNSKQN